MKPDTERKNYYSADIHERKKDVHVHLSKDLRGKLKKKTRSVGIRKGDQVKVMRGKHKGKQAKVSSVSVKGRVIYLEGVTRNNARGQEKPVALQPSNLMLLSLESTKERKELFSPDAFKKEEPKKEKKEENAPEKKEEPKKAEETKAEKKPEPKKVEAKKPEPKKEEPEKKPEVKKESPKQEKKGE